MDRHGGDPEGAAARGIEVLNRKAGGYGGVIVMNREGKVAVAFNTPRMARAWMTHGMASPVVEV